MPNRIQLTLQPPLAGMVRSTAYQTQPPFSSFDSLNFWVVDAKTGRLVVATRPSLSTLTAPAGAVSLLSTVSGVSSGNPFLSFVAAFDGTLYYWDGTQLTVATGTKATSIDTGRNVSAAALIDKVYITEAGGKPIVFDYTDPTNTEEMADTPGSVPTNTRIAVAWSGELVLAGKQESPPILYMSRVGVPTDWDFSVGPEDRFGAFFSDTVDDGKLSGPITALMPQNGQVLLVGTLSGTLALRGHPRQGGGFEPVGDAYPLGQGAWVKLPDGRILMLTPEGIMSLDPTPGAVLTPVSRGKIPDELKELIYTYDDPNVTMIYDSRWDGVHIFVRGLQEQAWRYDLVTGGFVRDEIGSYPFAAIEFNDFKTENTSGVLLGRYDGLKFFDRHGTEAISCSLTTAPVKISESQGLKSKIQQLRVVFGRDTPTETDSGELRLATGADGQDAIDRMLSGTHQYSISLTALKNNNGVCHPKLSGHAVVVSVSSDKGDVAIEEISLTAITAGRNRLPRSTQIAILGATTSFTDSFVDLDTSVWSGYAPGTPLISPASELPAYTHFLDLSKMPALWWIDASGNDVPNIDGGDIRVSDTDDVQVPSLVIDFDRAAQTGMLAFKMTQPTTPKSVRVWVGNRDTTTAPADSAYGSDNVFDANWRGFWPDGGGQSNQTQYDNNTETANEKGGAGSDAFAAIFGDEIGPMGAKATDFNQGDDTWWSIGGWFISQGLTAQEAWTMVGVFKRTASVVGAENMVWLRGSSFNHYHRMEVDDNSGGAAQTRIASFDGGSEDAKDVIGSTTPLNVWIQHAHVIASNTSRTPYVEGVSGVANTVLDDPDMDEDFFVGSNGAHMNGNLAMLQVHDVVRDAVWIKYQNDMLDQLLFWGTIGSFVLVNTIVEPTLDATACPSSFVDPTEVGSWENYAVATPPDPVSGSVSQFSHLIDLSAMPTAWWTAVEGEKDIRATNAENVFLPLDVIEFVDNGTSGTGLAVVRSTQSIGSPSEIRLWVGNASAVVVDKCSRYGQYSAYDPEWYGFWPAGSGNDRTQWLNHMTSVGSPTIVAADSPVGWQSTLFDNDPSTTMYATTTVNVPATVPYTLTASAKRPSGDIHEDLVLAAVQSSTTHAGAFLHTRPSSSPARLTTRNRVGSEQTAGNSATVAIASYWFQAGIAFGNNSRVVSVGTGGTSQSGQGVAVVEGIDTIVIGADILGTVSRGFKGHLALIGLHIEGRGDDWRDYWNAQLDQSTFWGTWVGVVESNSLTQP